MQKEVYSKLVLVLGLVITLISLFSMTVLAVDICFEDSECSDELGEGWVCDMATYECVEVDISGIETTSDSDSSPISSESDSETCSDGIDNDEDGYTDTDDPDCLDSDLDGVLDGADQCAGFDDSIDLDLDGTPDDCQSDLDTDGDGVLDSEDACEGYDDYEDFNLDGTPDGCESGATYDDSLLVAEISAVDLRVDDIETSVNDMALSVDELTLTVEELNTNVQLLSTDQYQLERDVEEQVNTVSTGLAVLQEDVKSTKTELESTQTDLEGTKTEIKASEAKASFFRTASIVIALGIIVGALGFFLRTHKQEEDIELTDEVRNFITGKIKLGMNEEKVVNALVKSGWKVHDAKWAFEHTTVHNYNKFLKLQGKTAKDLPKHKPSPAHYQKIAVISIISVLVLGAMLLFVKQSVGFAVYYEGISSEDLSSLVEERLEAAVELNSFYSLIDYAEICIQIEDSDDTSVAFEMLKTPYGHSMKEINTMCDENSKDYDFAVKFSNYNTFETLTGSMTCSGLESAHAVESGSVASRGMYILPSYYVGEGLEIVSGVDYSDYCAALSQCLSAADLALIGISC